MKLNMYSRIAFAVLLTAFLAACSATSADEDKKARLEKLKDQQASITKEIQKLESEIATKNPDSLANIRAKDVGITQLKTQNFDHYVQTQGHIESDNNVLVSAEAMGVVKKVYVTEGQRQPDDAPAQRRSENDTRAFTGRARCARR